MSQAAKSARADLLKLFREAGAAYITRRMAKCFTKAGAKVDDRDARKMMLEAIMGRKYAVVEELPKLGLDVNAVIHHGYPPLMYAVVLTNDPKAVKALITAGADVNAPMLEHFGDVTPLLAAARRKNADVVRELIAAGAKLDVRDPKREDTARSGPGGEKRSGRESAKEAEAKGQEPARDGVEERGVPFSAGESNRLAGTR